MPNPVVHFEILGRNAPALQRFYADVFGWTIQADNPMNYGLVESEEEGIGGGIAEADSPQALFYVEVDDPARYITRVCERGGSVVMDVQSVPGVVTFARFADPEGNIIGLVGAEVPPAE